MKVVKPRAAGADSSAAPRLQVVGRHLALDGYLDDLLTKVTETPATGAHGKARRLDTIEALFEAALSVPEKTDRGQSLRSRFESPTQCLRFGIDGIAYALPLLDIYRVVQCPHPIRAVPGIPAWCLGVVVVQGETVQVIDFQALAGKRQNFDYNYQQRDKFHLILLGQGNWALMVDEWGAVEELGAQDIQWYAEDRADNWQAGVVKQSLGTLLALRGVECALSLRG